MPRKGISYEQVAEACNELQESQRLSVRAIQARTGGSMTTVLKHYRRWQRERSGQQDVEQVISDRLRHALLSELEEAAARSTQVLRDKLQTTQQQMAAMQSQAAQTERSLTQRLNRVGQQQKQQQRKQLENGKRAAAAEKEIQLLQAQLRQEERALEREQRLRRQSEAACQQMQSQLQTAEERLLEQEKQLRTLEEQLQDPQLQKKESPSKKQGKKAQQSLFDF